MKDWAVCVQLTLNTGNMVLIEGDMNWCKIGYARLPFDLEWCVCTPVFERVGPRAVSLII